MIVCYRINESSNKVGRITAFYFPLEKKEFRTVMIGECFFRTVDDYDYNGHWRLNESNKEEKSKEIM